MKHLSLFLFWLLFSLPAQAQVPEDEASVRRAIDIQIADLWEGEDFVKLESISTEYRSTKSRTPSGLWRLTAFYASLAEQVSSDIDEPEWWRFMESRAKKWTARFPTSPAAHLQYAEAILSQAWHARGSGFSSTVAPEAMRTFRQKIEIARAYLEQHRALLEVDPRWHERMIYIATWQGWPEAKVQTLIEQAVAREPEFWQTYFAAAEYFSPYWRGNALELEKFANWAADRTGGAEGDALYTRIYWWSADRYFNHQFFDSKIDCERMMRGVDQLMNTYPDRWNVNNFARFAGSCGDRPRAKLLFSEIGDNPDLEAWGGSSKNFARFKAWANE